jgi:hypothetical protein
MPVLMAERIDRPPSLFGAAPADAEAPKRDDGLGGGLTLDEAIVGAWEGLAARAIVPCPCCGGALRPRHAASAGAAASEAVAGRCDDCGTTLD